MLKACRMPSHPEIKNSALQMDSFPNISPAETSVSFPRKKWYKGKGHTHSEGWYSACPGGIYGYRGRLRY